MERLKALPVEPSSSDVAHALDPIGLGGAGGFPASLAGHEASRVLAMLDAPKSVRSAALAQAKISDNYYDATVLVRAVHAVRGAKRAASGVKSQRTAALRALPESARHYLESAKLGVETAVEKARAVEALAKAGVQPAWAARSARVTARTAADRLKKLEDEILRKGGL
jgi:hypothetical protein